MSSVVGFTLYRGLTPPRWQAALAAQARALRRFPALVSECLPLGEATLAIWGRPDLLNRVWRAPDGAVAVLVGSPHGHVDRQGWVPDFVVQGSDPPSAMPWDGRTVVVRASDGGRRWDMWTDWVGSIPVYYAQVEQGWIASTLEPVVVAAAGFSPEDISVQALLGELVDGQYLNDSTLFDGMKTVPADCHATWQRYGFEWRRLWTVTPNSERWETDWDALVDEMHHLAREAIRDSLSPCSRWMIPISGGLDSRLIAAVGVELGTELHAYTWGDRAATDVVCARRIAAILRLPWQHVDLGTDYLRTQIGPWTDVFGSSMHLHGMYQMEFFRRLRGAPDDPVISGFLGDALSGYALSSLVAANFASMPCQLITDSYHHWSYEEAASLLARPARDALLAIERETVETLKSLPGAGFQQAILLNIWNRQRRFTGFSAWLADSERGVTTPFLSRAYASFCLSLPRAALDGRRLLADVFRRHYAALAAVPGTYATEPLLLTGQYLLKRRLARRLPSAFPPGCLRYVRSETDLTCVRTHGWKALWPIRDMWDPLGRWVDLAKVSRVAEAIFAGGGDMKSVRKLQSVQCLAFRLLKAEPAASGGP